VIECEARPTPIPEESIVRKVGAVIVALIVMATGLWAQQPLRVTRVLLYKNGMAYIVRAGQLASPLSLTFHPEDMNDVLKSFSAWNPETGALYSVGYTAGIPSTHLLSRYPFDITNPATGLGTFLIQVKGADVRLDQNGRSVEGKLLAVQQTDRATAPQTMSSDYRITLLLKDSSLQTMWLSDVRTVEFVDPQLREQLKSYLEVLAEGRQDVTREISVYPVPAPGPVQIAYLQQFPLWKTSYRVDLGARDGRIQGWAQIDNPTGEAWDNVSVSLISGAPVSFQMNLYDPLYTTRATVPVPGGLVAAPRQYEAAVRSETSATLAAAPPPPPAAAAAAKQAQDALNQGRMLADGMSISGGGGGGRGGRGGGAAITSAEALANAPLVPGAGGFQQADAARVEDLYEYKFPFPVRLASRQSALLPFLQKTMPIERLSIFNARTDRGNPRLGARVENNTDIPFEAGPVTFFQDTRYSGEAVLDYLPRGEKALVSFGVDYDIQMASKQASQPETTIRLTISKGIAVLYREAQLTTTYEIRNKGTEDKALIIEHPRFNNRKLKGLTAFETTDGFYRFRMSLSPAQSTTLAVPEVLSSQTNVSLTNLTRPQLALFAGAEMPAQVREKLAQIVDLQEQLTAMRADVQSTQGGIDTLFRDQERLRENLKALKAGVEEQQLRSRYLGQLRTQEDSIDKDRARIATVNGQITATQAKLSDLMTTLTFGN
jgi:hypothetical protein